MSRVALFGFLNFSALLIASLHAYQLNGTFYASCVYFAESRLSMMVLGTFGLYCMFLLARLIKVYLLGPLRLIEREHVTEYSWITLSETFLAMTIFKNEIDSVFVFAFAFLMIFKIFHWIIRDRIDYMEQVVQLPKDFIYKVGSLLSLLIFGSAFMVTSNVISVLQRGPSMAILFANEYALTMISLLGSAVRFSLNCIDALAPEEAFEQRSTVLFYLDFFVDLLKLLIYTGFFAVVMAYYGLPIHIIRDLYVTIVSFSKRVRDMIKYHQIMTSLQSRYPDVTPEELASCNDPTCIICREEMVSSVKRLPCGHFFHFKCLKSWLERQQICPTCRKSVLDVVKPAAAAVIPPQRPNPIYPGERPNWSETNSHYSQMSASQNSLTSVNSAYTSSNLNSNSNVAPPPRLLLSPLRRSHSTSSLFPINSALLIDEDEKDIERENLKISVELERFGRRSRSPLGIIDNSFSTTMRPSESTSTAAATTPLSPLSNVKSKIAHVEELMQEHEKILFKLREIETEICQERERERERSSGEKDTQ